MADYNAVSDALAKGTDPAMLCTTCPWDRNCITPPTLTKAEIDARIAEATAKDTREAQQRASQGRDPGMPAGTLMTTLVYAGRDTMATVCPVFALRLRSSGGRKIADDLRSSMQGWDDQS